jgi:hypothetical protein
VLQEKPEDWDNVIETQLNVVYVKLIVPRKLFADDVSGGVNDPRRCWLRQGRHAHSRCARGKGIHVELMIG